MHNQVAAGDFSYVEQMRAAAAQAAAAAAAAAAASQRAPNGLPEADEDSSSSEDEEDGSDDDDAMDAEVGRSCCGSCGAGSHSRLASGRAVVVDTESDALVG